MDPASSITRIIDFGISVFQIMESLREYIEAAPDQLQALQESCTAAILLLRRLEEVYERRPYKSIDTSEEFGQLGPLWTNIARCLKDVDAALKKLSESIKNGGKAQRRFRRVAICLVRKCYFKQDEVENATKKISILQTSLLMMIHLTNSHFLERVMTRTEELRPCNCSDDTANETNSSPPTLAVRDKVLPSPAQCGCGRHTPITVTPTPPESCLDDLSQSQSSLPLPEQQFASDGVQTRYEDICVPPEVRRPPPVHFSPRLPLSRPFNPRPASSPYLLQFPHKYTPAREEAISPSPGSPPTCTQLSDIRTFTFSIVFHAISDNGSISKDHSSFTKFV